MTPETHLDQLITTARARFAYIPEPIGADEWDTVTEFESRGGGDCDGFVIWTLTKAILQNPTPSLYWMVIGQTANGWHAWCELRYPTHRIWADPTWGLRCATPGSFNRTPYEAFPMTPEGLLGIGTSYH